MEKRLPQLYYIKMKISYDLGFIATYLKAFPVFNVLKTCRENFLTIDLEIVEFIKKFIEWFLEKCEIFRHGPNYLQKLYQKQLNAS